MPKVGHLLVSTILPDVFTITFPSISQSPFYHSIYLYSFSIRIDTKKSKHPLKSMNSAYFSLGGAS